MTKEGLIKILGKKIIQISLVGLIALIVGFVAGYEYCGYTIRRDLKEAFTGAFSNVFPNVAKVSESDNVEKEKTAELSVGQSFEDNGLTISVLEVKRSDTEVTKSDGTKLDSKIGFRVKVENKTKEDKHFSDLNFSLNSRVDDNKLTKMMFFDDNKNFAPELEGGNMIDGATSEGWITYFLPKTISDGDLQIIYNGDNTKVKFRLQ